MSAPQVEALASAPPVTVAGLTLFGVGIADWVQVLAAVWLVIQIGHFIYTKLVKGQRK